MSTLYDHNSVTSSKDGTSTTAARELDTGKPSDAPVVSQLFLDVCDQCASDERVQPGIADVHYGPQPPNSDGTIAKYATIATGKAEKFINETKAKSQDVTNEVFEDVKSIFAPDGLEIINEEFRINRAIATSHGPEAYPAVIDVGWNDHHAVPDPLINDVPNGEVWSLIRRFNKDVFDVKAVTVQNFQGLDPIEAWDNEHSTEKLTLHFQRVYVNIVLNLASFGKQLARLRSWREPRRTTAFCLTYFLAWSLDLLMPLVLATLMTVVTSKSARDALFPPVPRALVSMQTGKIERAQAGLLGTDNTLSGAPEKQKGEGVEEEAANFVDNVRHLIMRAVGMHEKPEKEGNPLEGKIPEPIRRTFKAIKEEGTAAGHTMDTTKQTEKPMEELIWSKAKPENVANFMKQVPHVVGEVVDTWERFANAMAPTAPFSRYSYLKIDAVLAPLFLLSSMVNAYTVYKTIGLVVGFVVFGDPIISQTISWLDHQAPHWKELLVPKNNILRGVPTNNQLALTLLRAGEAHRIPLPPVPSSNSDDRNIPVFVDIDKIPMNLSSDEKSDEVRPLTTENAYHESSPEDESTHRKHKHLSKIMRVFKGNTKAVVESKLAVDQVRAKLGSSEARKHIGVLPKPNNMVFAGPSKFKARFEGMNGWVHITEGAQPLVVFKKDTANVAVRNQERPEVLFEIPISEIDGLKRLSADVDKVIAKAADWSADKDLLGSVEIHDLHDKTWLLTGMPARNELFNRLIAISNQRWRNL